MEKNKENNNTDWLEDVDVIKQEEEIKTGAVEIVEAKDVIKVMEQLEKDNRLNETLETPNETLETPNETLETPNETDGQNKVENKQDNEPKVIKKRRTQGKKPKGEKGRMLRDLKNIWSTKSNKGSDIVASASLYAELMGWRLKTNELPNKHGDIMTINFTKDDPKNIPKPPANKMITAPVNKGIDTSTPTTTANDTQVVVVSDNK